MQLACLRALVGVTLLSCAASDAYSRLIDKTLKEVADEAQLIVLGRNEESTSQASPVVRFRIAKVLKGVEDKKVILVCNEAENTEAYDLSRFKNQYLLFAARGMDCYKPVYGVKSVFLVEGAEAVTSELTGEPDRQLLQELERKIGSLQGLTAKDSGNRKR